MSISSYAKSRILANINCAIQYIILFMFKCLARDLSVSYRGCLGRQTTKRSRFNHFTQVAWKLYRQLGNYTVYRQLGNYTVYRQLGNYTYRQLGNYTVYRQLGNYTGSLETIQVAWKLYSIQVAWKLYTIQVAWKLYTIQVAWKLYRQFGNCIFPYFHCLL